MRWISVEVEDHVATVVLDRPPVNAVDTETYLEIRRAFAGLNDDRDVRVAIFTAAGERAFMAGADLKGDGPRGDLLERPASQAIDPGLAVREAMWSITDCAVPVIGAINGAAIGAGLAFAACCDIILAAEEAFFARAAAPALMLVVVSSIPLAIITVREETRQG